MNYNRGRSEISTGDPIGFQHYQVGARFIQHMTKSKFSHVATALVAFNRVYVIEAVIPRVRIFPASLLLPFYHVPLYGTLSEEAIDFANSVVGDRYSIEDCIRAYRGETTDDNRWQCAELHREIHRRNGTVMDCPAIPKDVIEFWKIEPIYLTP